VVFKRGPKKAISPEDFDFKELFDAHYAMVLRHLMLVLGDRMTAEDIAQDTFIRLYERPPGDFTNLSGWLIRVSTNLAYNHLRGEKSRKRRETENAPPEVFEDDFFSSGEALEAREALQILDEIDRICLILKFSGFSYDEIAQTTGIKKSSVGKTLARALIKFKQVYERTRENVL